MESLLKLQDIMILTREINSLQPSSKEIVNDLAAIAESLGFKPLKMPIPFGAGSTDAGAFARADYEACTISSRDFKEAAFKPIDYHTSRDTLEKLEPSENTLFSLIQITAEMLATMLSDISPDTTFIEFFPKYVENLFIPTTTNGNNKIVVSIVNLGSKINVFVKIL